MTTTDTDLNQDLNYPLWDDPEVATMAPYIKTFGQSRPGFQLYSNAELLLLDQTLTTSAKLNEVSDNHHDQEIIMSPAATNADPTSFTSSPIVKVLPQLGNRALIQVVNTNHKMKATRSAFKDYLCFAIINLFISVAIAIGFGLFVSKFQDQSQWINPPAYWSNFSILLILTTLFFIYALVYQSILVYQTYQIKADRQWRAIGIRISWLQVIIAAIPILGLFVNVATYCTKIRKPLVRQNEHAIMNLQVVSPAYGTKAL